MNQQTFIITQNAILMDDQGKILILRHGKSRKWLLPGGKINKGEQWREALSREILEETGIIEWELISILDVDSCIINDDFFYIVTFVCHLKNNEIKLSDEHDQYFWITNIRELDKYEFWYNDIKKRIKYFFSKESKR